MLASPKYLAALAAVAIVANGAAYCWLRLRSPSPPPAKRSQQLVLGAFEYSRVSPRDKQVARGQILVTLHLAANLDAVKSRQVHDQEKPMQAAVEEAMRRLRASDLADPRYTRLKNRFEERLNDILGFEAIDDVIVTKMPEANAAGPITEQTADPPTPSVESDAPAGDSTESLDTNPKR